MHKRLWSLIGNTLCVQMNVSAVNCDPRTIVVFADNRFSSQPFWKLFQVERCERRSSLLAFALEISR